MKENKCMASNKCKKCLYYENDLMNLSSHCSYNKINKKCYSCKSSIYEEYNGSLIECKKKLDGGNVFDGISGKCDKYEFKC